MTGPTSFGGRDVGGVGDAPMALLSHLALDRDLTEPELVEAARHLAARRAEWDHYVRFSDTSRPHVSLHRDAHVEVWLICWTQSSDTGWHDHDTSAGAVAVCRGALVEHGLALGGPPTERIATAGSVWSFGPDHIHRLTGRDAESVSVHVYSPPLCRMGQYTTSADGVLRRFSVPYAEELRPHAAV